MERNKIINELSKYFSIVELVGPKEYSRDKDLCWRYLRTDLLHTLLVIRKDILSVPITVNTWKSGGCFDERGFRSNISDIVKSKTLSGSLYVSPHSLGAAVDFGVKGMDAEEARRRIREAQHLLPYPIRMESDVTWVHVDTFDNGNSEKITMFKG